MIYPTDCIYFKKDIKCSHPDVVYFGRLEEFTPGCICYLFPDEECSFREKYPEEE